MKRLTARTVTAKTIADGWHLDEHGLYLQVTGGGAGRSWVYRYVIDGRQRYMGLGPLADPEGRWGLTLAEAREKASDAHKLRLRGLDPLEERRRQEQARIAERARPCGLCHAARSGRPHSRFSCQPSPPHEQQLGALCP